MLQNFLFKSLLKSKLKDVPAEQQEKIFSAIEKNPDLFTTIAKKIEEKVKSGQSQQEAAMSVMMEHQTEIGEMMK